MDVAWDGGGHDRSPLDETPALSLFGFAGPACAARGWAVYPQEGGGGQRRPGTWRGRMIQLRQGGVCDLALTPPGERVVQEWAAENPNHNVACMLGRGSGGAVALDFDVETPERAAALRDLATRILGGTPFVRIGNAPRFAMIYRTDCWEGERRVVSLGRRFDVAAGARPGEAIEVLGEGRTITLLGRHHRTGRLFLWDGLSPMMAGPDAAPLVDGAVIALFLDEVHRRFPFAIESQARAEGWVWDEATRARVPRMRLAAGMAPWLSDPETGLVIDGREAFLTRTCFQVVMDNPEQVSSALGGGEGAFGALAGAIFDLFQRSVSLADGKWPEVRIRAAIQEKLRRLLRKVEEGRLRPRLPADAERVGAERIRLPPGESPPELRFLKPRERRSPRGLRGMVIEPPDRERAALMAIEPDREAVTRRVSRAVDESITRFLDEVYAWRGSPDDAAPVHLVKAPTGAGKTSRLLSALLADPRTTAPPPREDGQAWGPFVVLLPTFANIQELIDRLAREHGAPRPAGVSPPVLDLASGEFVPVDLAGPGGTPLSVFVYRGRIKAGCRMHEKVAALMRTGRSASSLCRAEIRDGDQRREIFCPHYGTCPAILQRERAASAHIVFMPHAFLTLAVPEQLRRPRAVIIDERVHHLLLHSARLSVDTLTLPRNPPRLTRKEREAGVRSEDLMADRELAVAAVLRGLERGKCPAVALVEEFGVERAAELVRAAARVCGAGLGKDERIHPGTSLEEILAICEEPRGFEIREEWRFWRLLEERLRGQPAGEEAPSPDVRLQRLVEREVNGFERVRIRLSWRSLPNWRDVPTLLLDASGEPALLRKVFPTPSLIVSETAPDPGPMLNVRIVACVDRTFSSSSLLPSADADETERKLAERGIALVREIIEGVALAHGHGRVLAGGPKAVLARLRDGWNPPVNVDWAHYGAMRGLDGFKAHAAAVSIGRMEPPIWEVDAGAAALSHDEENPEFPFDVRGDGRSPQDPEAPLRYPLVKRPIRMRDGSVLGIAVPEHPGAWGRLVQAQIREEEQKQFLGRLRPVHRTGGPPVWYCLSSVVPDGVVVDEICSSRDLFEASFLRLARQVARDRGLLRRSFWSEERGGLPCRHLVEALTAGEGVDAPLRELPDDAVEGFSHALACLPRETHRLRILARRAAR